MVAMYSGSSHDDEMTEIELGWRPLLYGWMDSNPDFVQMRIRASVVGGVYRRCDGTGRVYDEVFEHEWTECPYMDVERGVACRDGIVTSIDEAIPLR